MAERPPACEDGRGGWGFRSRQRCLGLLVSRQVLAYQGLEERGWQASHRFSKGGKLFAEAALEQPQGLCAFLVEVSR